MTSMFPTSIDIYSQIKARSEIYAHDEYDADILNEYAKVVTDNDGTLDKIELQELIADIVGNGRITPEIQSLIDKILAGKDGISINDLIEKLDKDNNGKLSTKEILGDIEKIDVNDVFAPELQLTLGNSFVPSEFQQFGAVMNQANNYIAGGGQFEEQQFSNALNMMNNFISGDVFSGQQIPAPQAIVSQFSNAMDTINSYIFSGTGGVSPQTTFTPQTLTPNQQFSGALSQVNNFLR